MNTDGVLKIEMNVQISGMRYWVSVGPKKCEEQLVEQELDNVEFFKGARSTTGSEELI